MEVVLCIWCYLSWYWWLVSHIFIWLLIPKGCCWYLKMPDCACDHVVIVNVEESLVEWHNERCSLLQSCHRGSNYCCMDFERTRVSIWVLTAQVGRGWINRPRPSMGATVQVGSAFLRNFIVPLLSVWIWHWLGCLDITEAGEESYLVTFHGEVLPNVIDIEILILTSNQTR